MKAEKPQSAQGVREEHKEKPATASVKQLKWL
jgi:hypothetical protein